MAGDGEEKEGKKENLFKRFDAQERREGKKKTSFFVLHAFHRLFGREMFGGA